MPITLDKDDSYRSSLYEVRVEPAYRHVHKLIDGVKKTAIYPDEEGGKFLGYRVRLEWPRGGGQTPSGEEVGRHTYSKVFKNYDDAVKRAKREHNLSNQANLEICDPI
jgi:hypothetical protein